MTEENDIMIQQKIKKMHSRIVTVAGTFMGVVLSIYFFTYSTLLDQGNNFLLWFEIITAVLFIFGLIYLKRLALFITRILLSTDSDCRRMLKGITVADLEKMPE
jgi:cobalamin biosynthesis protein CobD/CbiB